MNIFISNSSDKPIYDQIVTQMKNLILTGSMKEGELLPSMRFLAKELRISVITTKRAYDELEREGFIETVAGKGSYVSSHNKELIKEEHCKRMEQYLEKAVSEAKTAGISIKEMQEALQMIYTEFEA